MAGEALVNMNEATIKVCKEITLAKSWELYSSAIFSGMEPGPIQVEETRRTFYASFYEAMMMISDISTYLSEDDAVKKLDELKAETKAFAEEIRTRHKKNSAAAIPLRVRGRAYQLSDGTGWTYFIRIGDGK